MVILRINNSDELSRDEYKTFGSYLVREYEYCKTTGGCLVIPRYIDVFVVDDDCDVKIEFEEDNETCGQ